MHSSIQHRTQPQTHMNQEKMLSIWHGQNDIYIFCSVIFTPFPEITYSFHFWPLTNLVFSVFAPCMRGHLCSNIQQDVNFLSGKAVDLTLQHNEYRLSHFRVGVSYYQHLSWITKKQQYLELHPSNTAAEEVCCFCTTKSSPVLFPTQQKILLVVLLHRSISQNSMQLRRWISLQSEDMVDSG